MSAGQKGAPARVFAVVPAAGVGRRFGSGMPKQYLELCGRAVLAITLERLVTGAAPLALAVALNPRDRHFERLCPETACPLLRVTGGTERSDSVASALEALHAHGARAEDWVLVHDAVRPCLRPDDVRKLITAVADTRDGGLLAVPVRDTLKRAAAAGGPAVVEATVTRERLWHALTPQAFRLGPLRQALAAARDAGLAVTDEASAMEHQGARPLLVEGSPDNLKITRRDDLALAAQCLAAQTAAGASA